MQGLGELARAGARQEGWPSRLGKSGQQLAKQMIVCRGSILHDFWPLMGGTCLCCGFRY